MTQELTIRDVMKWPARYGKWEPDLFNYDVLNAFITSVNDEYRRQEAIHFIRHYHRHGFVERWREGR